jgi:integrase
MILKLYREGAVIIWETIEEKTVDEVILIPIKVRNRLIFTLMAREGMRIGEVLILRLKDIQDRQLTL